MRIVNVSNGNIIRDIPTSIYTSYSKYYYLIFRGNESTGFYAWIFDSTTSELFRLEGKFYVLSSSTFEKNGESLIISNLWPYKVR